MFQVEKKSPHHIPDEFNLSLRHSYDSFFTPLRSVSEPSDASRDKVRLWLKTPKSSSIPFSSILQPFVDVKAFDLFHGRPKPVGHMSVMGSGSGSLNEWLTSSTIQIGLTSVAISYMTYFMSPSDEHIPKARAIIERRRSAFRIGLVTSTVGMSYVLFQYWRKSKSPLQALYKLNNRERFMCGLAMGTTLGLVYPSSGYPFYNQYPRGSIIFWINFTVFLYYWVCAGFFMQLLEPHLSRRMRRFKGGFEAEYNDAPWFMKEPLQLSAFQPLSLSAVIAQPHEAKQWQAKMEPPLRVIDEYSPHRGYVFY